MTSTYMYTLYTAKINETSTFGPADDDITFDYDGDDYGDDNDEEDIDTVSNLNFNYRYIWRCFNLAVTLIWWFGDFGFNRQS